VQFHWWAHPTRVQTEREEALELVEDLTGRHVSRIRRHLAECTEVVALELGLTQLEDMGLVFAGAFAKYLAVQGDGLIRNEADEWWAVKMNGAPVLLVG
jgi:hypothetical protein